MREDVQAWKEHHDKVVDVLSSLTPKGKDRRHDAVIYCYHTLEECRKSLLPAGAPETAMYIVSRDWRERTQDVRILHSDVLRFLVLLLRSLLERSSRRLRVRFLWLLSHEFPVCTEDI